MVFVYSCGVPQERKKKLIYQIQHHKKWAPKLFHCTVVFQLFVYCIVHSQARRWYRRLTVRRACSATQRGGGREIEKNYTVTNNSSTQEEEVKVEPFRSSFLEILHNSS